MSRASASPIPRKAGTALAAPRAMALRLRMVFLLTFVLGCHPRRKSPLFELPRPSEARGPAIALRYAFVPGQNWRYDAESSSLVVTSSGAQVTVVLRYLLDLAVERVDAGGTADVTISFRDFVVKSTPRIGAAQLPDFSRARIQWRLGADGSVRDVHITDEDTNHLTNGAQLAMAERSLEAFFQLAPTPVQKTQPWRSAQVIPLALPHGHDAIDLHANETAWIEDVNREQARITRAAQLTLPSQTVRASALLPEADGVLEMQSEGRSVSDVIFD